MTSVVIGIVAVAIFLFVVLMLTVVDVRDEPFALDTDLRLVSRDEQAPGPEE